MKQEKQDRRSQQRCIKDVGMHCSLLNKKTDTVVTLRNFNERGVYFESGWKIQPGTLVVLRAMDATDFVVSDATADMPQYCLKDSDPGVCTGFRSHTVAKVQRCEKLDGYGDQPYYGIGAEIQILTY